MIAIVPDDHRSGSPGVAWRIVSVLPRDPSGLLPNGGATSNQRANGNRPGPGLLPGGDSDGARFWIFRAGLHGGDRMPRWYLHGLFG